MHWIYHHYENKSFNHRYIIDKIFIKKWLRGEELVPECPNCHAQTDITETISKCHEQFERETHKLESELNELRYEVITKKKIESEQKYV
jgi:hypothetical protein